MLEVAVTSGTEPMATEQLDPELRPIPAPDLEYRPPIPSTYSPRIGLIGCGEITKHHLAAYRDAGFEVVAFADLDIDKAIEQRDLHYPNADAYGEADALLERDDLDIVDIATHPGPRVALIEAALAADKHVLSQKPFVLDTRVGARLCDEADSRGLKLAVNQNGRWAPHVAYLREAVAAGLLGTLRGVQLTSDFDHEWVIDTPFNDIHDLILYDYAIHWFDMLSCYFTDREALQVSASTRYAASQEAAPPLLAHVIVDYSDAQATLAFNGATTYGKTETSVLVGTDATARSTGPTVSVQEVEIHTPNGIMRPELEGAWYDDGFHGTMAELVCAIEEERTPFNDARSNLRSLELCFAAVASAHQGGPVVPGEVTALPMRSSS